jgi:hypothetical protein
VSRALERVGGRLPKGWSDALRQFGLFLLAYQGYQLVRGLAEGRETLAFANADRLIDLERALGTYFEPGFQQALLDDRWLIDFANWAYMNTHFVITTSFLVWLYLFRNEHFYFVRNMFMVAMGLALVGYAAFPTAPPRLVPDAGYTDTITAFTGVKQDTSLTTYIVNPYAAVPSMHIGFALMVAVSSMLLVRNLVVRAFWFLYPFIVLFVIVVTANHFWLDAAAGAAVAVVSALVAHHLLAAVRPGAWAWRPAPGEATA